MSEPKKRMGGMTLRGMGGLPIEPPASPHTADQSTNTEDAQTESKPITESPATDSIKTDEGKPKTSAKRQTKGKTVEKLTTVNIKIKQGQQEWLADTARLVRDNNDDPVRPSDRVYPQHLIGVAIDLLKSADVDWGSVRNVQELRDLLELKG